ncbi:hypothetical protein [Chryseobacterium sp. CH1]
MLTINGEQTSDMTLEKIVELMYPLKFIKMPSSINSV